MLQNRQLSPRPLPPPPTPQLPPPPLSPSLFPPGSLHPVLLPLLHPALSLSQSSTPGEGIDTNNSALTLSCCWHKRTLLCVPHSAEFRGQQTNKAKQQRGRYATKIQRGFFDNNRSKQGQYLAQCGSHFSANVHLWQLSSCALIYTVSADKMICRKEHNSKAVSHYLF